MKKHLFCIICFSIMMILIVACNKTESTVRSSDAVVETENTLYKETQNTETEVIEVESVETEIIETVSGETEVVEPEIETPETEIVYFAPIPGEYTSTTTNNTLSISMFSSIEEDAPYWVGNITGTVGDNISIASLSYSQNGCLELFKGDNGYYALVDCDYNNDDYMTPTGYYLLVDIEDDYSVVVYMYYLGEVIEKYVLTYEYIS